MADSAAITQIVCRDLENCESVEGSTIKRILIPFDNSPHAVRACSHALDFAKKFGAKIFVLAIFQDNGERSWLNDTPGREKIMNKNSKSAVKSEIRKLKGQAAKFGLVVETFVLESPSVADRILSFITNKKIDFVIMGTRGNGMAKEMLLGRVSTNIALNANCPVVLIK